MDGASELAWANSGGAGILERKDSEDLVNQILGRPPRSASDRDGEQQLSRPSSSDQRSISAIRTPTMGRSAASSLNGDAGGGKGKGAGTEKKRKFADKGV